MQNKFQGAPLAPAVMVHFYRGVMDLTTTWRGRIDGTTNWAVISSGSIASFLLSEPGHSHLTALLGMFLTFAFLTIEARRYRFYHLWSGWIRLMETEYYETLLRSNVVLPSERWHVLLDRDLGNPHFKISWSTAVGLRLRHNYMAIFSFLLLTWITKLLLHPEAAVLGEALRTIRERAAVGPFPGEIIITMVALFYCLLVLLMLVVPSHSSRGNETLGRHLVMRQLVNPGARRVGFKRYGMQGSTDGASSDPGRNTAHYPHPTHAPEED